MRVRCDGVSDAAYVYFCEAPGQVAFMVATEPEIPWGMINLDFDSEHHLIGIEVLPASYFPAIITASTIRVTYDRSLDAARVYFREFGVGEALQAGSLLLAATGRGRCPHPWGNGRSPLHLLLSHSSWAFSATRARGVHLTMVTEHRLNQRGGGAFWGLALRPAAPIPRCSGRGWAHIAGPLPLRWPLTGASGPASVGAPRHAPIRSRWRSSDRRGRQIA